MATKRKKKQVGLEHVAKLIEQIAQRVETLNYDFDIQVTISAVEQVLIETRHLDGLKLLNCRLLLNTKNGKATSNRYRGYVQKQLAKIPPLDPTADSTALRALAAEITAITPHH